jgi:hypothetical protein
MAEGAQNSIDGTLATIAVRYIAADSQIAVTKRIGSFSRLGFI